MDWRIVTAVAAPGAASLTASGGNNVVSIGRSSECLRLNLSAVGQQETPLCFPMPPAGLLLDDRELDPSVLEAAIRCIVAGNRLAIAVALCPQHVRFDADVDQRNPHSIRPLLRQYRVGLRIPVASVCPPISITVPAGADLIAAAACSSRSWLAERWCRCRCRS